MKTFLKIMGAIAVLAAILVFVGATSAFAQGPAPNATPAGGSQARGSMNADSGLITVDESMMHAAIAEALGVSVDELEAALAAGETPATLALQLGVDFSEVRAAMDAVHGAAIAQAVADGLITQEQANWILSHRGGQNGQQGNGVRGGMGGNGGQTRQGMGGGGGYGGECPNVTP